jgi:hypothetical protein
VPALPVPPPRALSPRSPGQSSGDPRPSSPSAPGALAPSPGPIGEQLVPVEAGPGARDVAPPAPISEEDRPTTSAQEWRQFEKRKVVSRPLGVLHFEEKT